MNETEVPTRHTGEEARVEKRRRLTGIALLAISAATVALLGSMLVFDLSPQVIGILTILSLVLTMFLGVPIAVAMIVVAFVALYSLSDYRLVEQTFTHVLFGALGTWELSVIPLFIFMGIVMGRTGLVSGAYSSARLWLGRLPAGLGVATNFAGAGLSAATGTTIGIAYALGRVSIPEMLKAGYRPSFAVGTVAGAGVLGQIIPPSILLVIYAGVAQTPVGPQLLAGFGPGLLLTLAFAVMMIVRAAMDPTLAPASPVRSTWVDRVRGSVKLLPIAAIISVVIGGLYSGIFTATESAAVGALVATVFGVVALVRKGVSPAKICRVLRDSAVETVISTAAIFLLIVGVHAFTRAIALSRTASDLAAWVSSMSLDPVAFLLVLVVVFLVLGMFMDTLAMMLLTLPVLLPVVAFMGIDPIWFGIFVVVMAEIGLLTPPLGVLNFVLYQIVSDRRVSQGHSITLAEIFRGSTWFVITSLIVVLLMIWFPEIAMWLPDSATR